MEKSQYNVFIAPQNLNQLGQCPVPKLPLKQVQPVLRGWGPYARPEGPVRTGLAWATIPGLWTCPCARTSKNVALMILFVSNKVEAYSDEGCQGNFRELVNKCKDYIAKDDPNKDPSQECCALIRGADIACMCGHIDPDVKEAISGEKVLYCQILWKNFAEWEQMWE